MAKNRVANRSYINGEGEKVKTPPPDGMKIIFDFVESDHELVMDLGDLSDAVVRQAALFGVNTSVGNAYGGAPDAEKEDAAETRWATLCEGRWSAERSITPRTKDVTMAIVEALVKGGKYADTEEDRQIAYDVTKEKVDADENDYVKNAQKNPSVSAELDAIRLRRLQEKIARRSSEDTGEGDLATL